MHDEAPELEGLHAAHITTQRARFDRALETCGYSSVLLYSGALAPIFRDDQAYPFKAHAWFKAWIPLTAVQDCFLYYAPGRVPLVLLHKPIDYWYKPAELPQSFWTGHVELQPVTDRPAARAALPRDLGSTAYIGDAFPELEGWGLAASNPAALLARLDYERAVKTPYELACMREANRIAARGHLAAAEAFRGGGSEFEIELAFLRACAQREEELPYNPIIALNESGAVLHYQVLERARPDSLRSMLIDAGAAAYGYASDVTRTYSHADADFAALIAGFDEVQQALCASVHAGIDWRDVHLSAHRLVAEFLQDAQITTCDAEEAVDTGVSSVFLPHGVGHLLGLQVHDVGGLLGSPEGTEIPRPEGHPYLRLTRVLEEGFVVTMEPGIYFIDQLLDAARADARAAKINWARVAQLKSFGGIRIEDDLAVGVRGAENLTRDAFSAAQGN
ncbi:MAG TPA: Xaa-Pro dipeptidase [Steroidobacteraceae bacterium]|nr:Xaa-Pro dipeptidase [Steroidobacteraceae bacterium]